MNEFIKKLIERLEEVYDINDKSKKGAYEEQDWEEFDLFTHRNEGVYSAISIVNQLAEEYNNESVKGDLIRRSDVIQHIRELKTVYGVPMTDRDKQVIHWVIGHIKNDIPTSYNDGWIPCRVDTPKIGGWYLAHVEHNRGAFITIEKVLWKKCKYGSWKWYRKGNDCEVIAWQPLPAPYQTKGE